MSSLFAARIIVGLLRRQTTAGIAGHIAEIGVFEGRLLIAMALSLAEGERVLAIDPFTWPDLGLRGRFEANCAAHGVPAGRLAVLQRDSRSVTPRRLLDAAAGGTVRFFHIDGEHMAGHLASDLRLAAAAAAAPEAIIALDDMLRPGYPTLALTVHAFLDAEPGWRVLAIIDREDIVGAAKYLLCRRPAVAGYEAGCGPPSRPMSGPWAPTSGPTGRWCSPPNPSSPTSAGRRGPVLGPAAPTCGRAASAA